jgi:hypothetical protein
MEVYKRETQEIVNRFLGHRLTFPDCIAALDAALTGLVPKLKPDQLPELRAVMLANNARVMTEMERRERARKAHAKARADAKNLQIEPTHDSHNGCSPCARLLQSALTASHSYHDLLRDLEGAHIRNDTEAAFQLQARLADAISIRNKAVLVLREHQLTHEADANSRFSK